MKKVKKTYILICVNLCLKNVNAILCFGCSVLEKSDPSLVKVGYYIPPSQRALEINKASSLLEQDLL